MNGKAILAIRESIEGFTQAEMARALEVSPVTLNRWENDDPRYRPAISQVRLLEALDELVRRLDPEERLKLLDLLRVATVAGIIGKAAIARMLPNETINRLAATPGLGWIGMIAGVGVGAALPFFPRLSRAEQSREVTLPRRRAKPKARPIEEAGLYTLGIDAL
jgi:transcriptional regulator with XRE-family HTH domain